MRLPILPILMVLAIGVLVDWYICRRMRAARAGRTAERIYVGLSAVVTLAMIIVACIPKRQGADGQLLTLMWALFTYFSVYVPKYIFALISLVQQALSAWLKRPLSGIAIGGAVVCAIIFIAFWWGALVTRFSVDVKEVEIPIANLPKAFDGYRIVQISDIHTGTYGNNPRFLEKVVKTVDELKPDIILFTGDIVNRHSTELEPFMAVLSGLNAPDGVWSIMGNHDYGEYYRWAAESERLKDVDNLQRMQKAMGWRMLNNESAALRRGNDSIILIGVENIGDPPFPVYGDLKKAYPEPGDSTVKILMSHNPAHWTRDIENNKDVNVALTLSGHTHGMQIEVFGASPAAWRYPTWGGLYTDSLGRKLYVNIGLGEVGFPARIGATPEITLITLTDERFGDK